jgi:murein DD-endopeptidase MepM/ murein hydrolase activator NlpD
MPQCVNDKCACPDCSCGVGCTCGISSEVSCDPCNEFKANKMMQAATATPSIKWESHDFSKVMPAFPSSSFEVLDLSKPDAVNAFVEHVWTIGKYDEVRSIYQTELFSDGRNLHVGLDIGGPIGTPVHAFLDGKVRTT